MKRIALWCQRGKAIAFSLANGIQAQAFYEVPRLLTPILFTVLASTTRTAAAAYSSLVFSKFPSLNL